MKRRIGKWLITGAVILLLLILLSVFEIRCFGCFPAIHQNRRAYYRGEAVHVCVNNFPDRNFRQFIRDTWCTDGSNVLSHDLLNSVTEMDCSGIGCDNIRGIELFTKLKKLDCSGNHIKYLPVDNLTALTELDCANNQISELILYYNMQLQTLNCERNRISRLNFSNQNVTKIDCSDNLLTDSYCFDSLKATLSYLDCGNNCFRDLNLHGMEALTQMFLSPQKAQVSTVAGQIHKDSLLSSLSKNRVIDFSANESTAFYTVRVFTKTAVAEMEVVAECLCSHRYEHSHPFDLGKCIYCGAPKTNQPAWVKIFLWAFPLGLVMFLVAVIYLRRRKVRGKDWGEVTNVQIHDRDLQNPDRKR